MELLVNAREGVVLEKKVYTQPEGRLHSWDRYSDFSKVGEGYLPTRISYEHQGLRTEILLKIKSLEPLPDDMFSNLTVPEPGAF